ncbi:MAG: hypothetical protein ACK2U9_05625, partial [Anaerolineae bacterium]
DVGRSVAVDSGGNVHVTGRASRGARNADFVTIKYDPTGEVLWTAYRDWSVNDDARYLALDQAGNVYVTGDIVSHTTDLEKTAHQDLGMVKFGPEGKEQWAVSFNGGDASNEVSAGLQLGPEGGVYLLGTILPAGEPGGQSPPPAEFVVAIYDADGVLTRDARHQGAEQAVSMAQGLALDAYGNAYVLASDRGTPGGDPMLTLIKFGSLGEERWVVRHAGSATTAGRGVAVGADGAVWIAGSDESDNDYLTAKYTESKRAASPKTPVMP